MNYAAKLQNNGPQHNRRSICGFLPIIPIKDKPTKCQLLQVRLFSREAPPPRGRCLCVFVFQGSLFGS